MIIQPKIRGFICTAAHPQGCFRAVQEQVDYVKSKKRVAKGPKRVLVIGASTGYGLASRIAATFGYGAETIGVSLERPADGKRTASPGWYNTAAFEIIAKQQGLQAVSINGDAFSHEVKQQAIAAIKKLGPVDLVIYSLASPRRTHPDTGQLYSSVLKPIGKIYRNKTIDPFSGIVKEVEIEPATETEIKATEMVMGGEDWQMWIEQLLAAEALSTNVMTLAYSYIGPELTHPIYKDGTIGAAKRHLHQTAQSLNGSLNKIAGTALISVNKALVTQASSAIPVVPLYISLLYKVMKEQGSHEGCIQQAFRLLEEKLYCQGSPVLDQQGLCRLDDWEMDPKVQEKVTELWKVVNTENLGKLADLQGYQKDFYQLFGFAFSNIDYESDTNIEVDIPSIKEKHNVGT
ncbi:MAG: trans-2-enoyl-CoA reductase family protein [Proteobacteria bacterium]|nr:trans-2-enoyl-CoA reductase family protein [Pseudomonadota bacterium]